MLNVPSTRNEPGDLYFYLRIVIISVFSSLPDFKKKYMYIWFRAILNYQKIEVALNCM